MPSKIHEHTYNLQQQMPRVPLLLENRFMQRFGINSNFFIGDADTNWKNQFDIVSINYMKYRILIFHKMQHFTV